MFDTTTQTTWSIIYIYLFILWSNEIIFPRKKPWRKKEGNPISQNSPTVLGCHLEVAIIWRQITNIKGNLKTMWFLSAFMLLQGPGVLEEQIFSNVLTYCFRTLLSLKSTVKPIFLSSLSESLSLCKYMYQYMLSYMYMFFFQKRHN